MKIFVSSLISGFEPLRVAARNAIQSLGHEPVMAEDFGAQAKSPQLACLQGLRSADLVILILGERYGAVPAGSKVSPTHEEYLEARGTKEILLFVQDGITPEQQQAALLSDAQGWNGGLFRTGFSTPDEFRNKVTTAIHRYELAHMSAPLDVPELLAAAEAMLTARNRDAGHSVPKLRVALTAGPRQQILRPAELESAVLCEALHKTALFGPPRIFEPALGVESRMDGDVLFVEQKTGAGLSLDEKGSLTLRLPLERPSDQRSNFNRITFGIIEESVLGQLVNAIAFADWVLDYIDPTQRLTHVAVAAKIEASDYMGWRTQAEQDASPNAGTMRMASAPERPVRLDRPRGALKFDAKRLSEDLMVPLRRQWKG